MTTPPTPSTSRLARALAAVGDLVAEIGDDQWSAPTPCTDWNIRELVTHLVGMNRVFVAILTGGPPPTRGDDPLGDDPVAAYRDSGAKLVETFGDPAVLDRTFESPIGTTTGAARLQWRIADLLAHGWDLAEALGRPVELPEDLVEQSLIFVKAELPKQSRAGRFDEPQPVRDDAPAIEQLVAFVGRQVHTD